MTILFLHGLREDPENNNILQALKTTGNTIIHPRLNPWEPIKTLESLKQYSPDLCIGFSLGGLFASALNIGRKILINPALCFPNILKQRKRPETELIKEYESFPWFHVQNLKAIFTTEDEKVGLKSLPIFLNHYPESEITYIPGGHNLTKTQILETLIPMI